MNEQKPPNAIEWTRILKPDGTYTKGFTWNVLAGCMHDCKWTMPNGEVAQCYAKTVAEGVARGAYKQGFAHHYFHPERLEEPLKVKEPAGIFLDSMSDLMGTWVPEHEIEQVLDVCRRAHWHTFFLLTKNAPRLAKFEFPPNVWVGASSPPDSFLGKPLNRDQQSKMLHRTLKTLQSVKAEVRWISFEPLSWDCSEIVAQYPGAINWAVIGAASNGPREFPPALVDLQNMLAVLKPQSVPVFYKGNMRTLEWAKENWRHEFPRQSDKPRGDAGDLPDTKPAPKPKTKVVSFYDVMGHWNRQTRTWDSPDYVYIGRSNVTYGLPTSAWANPFKITVDTPVSRLAAIHDYRTYIKKLLQDIPTLRDALEDLRGKKLVCWCSPKACHGHVLLELLGEVLGVQEEKEPEAQQIDEPPQQLALFDLPTVRQHYD